MKKGRLFVLLFAVALLLVVCAVAYPKVSSWVTPATSNSKPPLTEGDQGSSPSPKYDGSELFDTSAIQDITLIDCHRDADSGHSETNESAVQITDEVQIAEIIDTILAIEWSPKAEGDWPKYSVDRPDYSIEIHTFDCIVKINLFDQGFVAVLTDEHWQRYEISESYYETLKQYCQISEGGV